MKILKRPEMISRHAIAQVEVETREPDEFLTHCDNIALILAETVFLWRANRKIKRYLELTGAKLENETRSPPL